MKLVYFKDNDLQRVINLEKVCHANISTSSGQPTLNIFMGDTNFRTIVLQGEIAEKVWILLKSTSLFIE